MHKKLLIIDGSAIIHRAYHALPRFTSSDGVPTNAVYGFIKMLLSLINKIEAEYVVVAMDTPKPTFRKKLFKEYQSQRPKAPDDFKVQVPLVQEFLKLARIHYCLKEGFEADDVIGSIVKDKHLTDIYCYIITGDKDILQLVDQKTTVIMPIKGVSVLGYYDIEKVQAKLGIDPPQIVDYKALVGDLSDNYPGVKGIGPKKAADLLKTYNTLAGVYENLEALDKRTKELLIQDKEKAYLSKELAQIRTDLETDFKLEQSRRVMDQPSEELFAFLDKLSLNTIKQQLKKQIKNKKLIRVDKKDQNQLSFF